MRLLLQLVLLLGLYVVVPARPSGAVWVRTMIYVGAVVALALVVGFMVRTYVRTPQASSLRVGSVILAALAVALLFAMIYATIAATNPAQIPGLVTKVDALYFSLVTMATVGFGDIHAAGQLARSVVITQIIFDGVIVAALAQVGSALVSSRRGDAGPDHPR